MFATENFKFKKLKLNNKSIRIFYFSNFFMINLILLLLIFKATLQPEAKKKPHDKLHLT